MSFEMVDKAMELKELIDAAHLYLPQIGQCISLAQDYMQERFGLDYDTGSDSESEYSLSDEDSDQEEQKEQKDEGEEEVPKARTIQAKLRCLFNLKNHAMGTFNLYDEALTVHDMEFKMDAIMEDTVKAWYTSATNSSCGDVVAQQPQHDSKVGSWRELDASKFTVNQETLDHVAGLWSDNFDPKAVVAQPYKLVIYGPGDHVAWHNDAPEEKFCGTFLVSLFQENRHRNVFEIKQDGKAVSWDSWQSWCAFYPDTPHRMKTLESGYRVVLSFKIFAKENSPEQLGNREVPKMVDKIVKDLQNTKDTVGILLQPDYGHDSKTSYGYEKLLLDSMEGKGLKVDIKPVLIHFWGEKYDVGSSVYEVTDNALDVVRKELAEFQSGAPAKRRKLAVSNIKFIDGMLGGGKSLWQSEAVFEDAWYRSQPHSESSVYVRYAAIIKPSGL
jgi:hypothetical protein